MRTTAFSTVILKFIIYTVLIVSHAEWKSPDSLQMSLVAHFFKLSMVLRYGTYESELDTRKYCRDNETMCSGHKVVCYCNITIFCVVCLLHPDAES